MGDYEEDITFKCLSFLRLIMYKGTEAKLFTIVSNAEKELKDRMKRHQGIGSDSDEDLDPLFKAENLRVISYENEMEVHKEL